jgi:hypothetical protein
MASNTGELLIVLLFHRLDLARKLAVGVHQATELDERAHDGDVDFDCSRRTQHAREHRNALLGEGIGRIKRVSVLA